MPISVYREFRALPLFSLHGKLLKCKGVARSLSLDIYAQWEEMEKGHGKWRFTSPTHVVRAFFQALKELKAEGGIEARYRRYCRNHEVLVEGMQGYWFFHLAGTGKAVSGYYFFSLSGAGFFVYRVLWVAETTGFCHLSRKGFGC